MILHHLLPCSDAISELVDLAQTQSVIFTECSVSNNTPKVASKHRGGTMLNDH